MSFDDDATDDPAGFRPPPHPDDRLWRHPSELIGARRAPASAGAEADALRTGHHTWGTVAVAAAGIALVAAGASVMTMGLQERAADSGPVQQAAIYPLGGETPPSYGFSIGATGSSEPDPAQLERARDLAPSVVRVDTGVARGSGVVVSEDGMVVTSADVIADHEHVAVGLADGRLLVGEVLGTDVLTGLAVVDLPGEGYEAATVADPPGARAGGQAYALGVDDTGRVLLAAGQLATTHSAVERAGMPILDGILVLDAITHNQAHGGPVVDENGALVGLTTWTDAARGYVTPVAAALNLVDDMEEAGSARHPWLGIVGSNAAADAGPAGIEIIDVMIESPCVSVLLPGDRIVALHDQPVTDMSGLVAELREHDPGDDVLLTYWRRDRGIVVSEDIVLGDRADHMEG